MQIGPVADYTIGTNFQLEVKFNETFLLVLLHDPVKNKTRVKNET